MKRIAIDCRLVAEGGVGRYIKNLVYHLAEFDTENEYTLWTYGNSKFEIQPASPKLQRGENSKLSSNFKVKSTGARWHSWDEQFKFWKELESENYDLVHFPYFSHPIFYRRPFVTTIHDLTILHFATGKATTKNPLVYRAKRLGYLLALRHAIAESRHIIVPTQFVKRDIIQSFHSASEKISVTYEGVGTELIHAKEQNPFDAERKGFFLYIGNFYPHKNVEFLLHSFQRLKRKETLVLAGPNDFFTARMRALVESLGLLKSVTFISKPSDGELKYLYTHAKALVLPSLFEGFGLPVVEATYLKCPLILSDIPVFREIALPNTVFFDPKNVSDLVEKLSGTSSYIHPGEQYFERFSFKKMSQDTLQIYKDALS